MKPPPSFPSRSSHGAAAAAATGASAQDDAVYISPRCEIDDDVLFPYRCRRKSDNTAAVDGHDDGDEDGPEDGHRDCCCACNDDLRWDLVSNAAGPHRQDGSVMTVSRHIAPRAFKFGITPGMASRVRTLNLWQLNSALYRNEEILPEWLDVVSTLFPNLEHITLSKGVTPSSSAAFPSPRIPLNRADWSSYEEDDVSRITRVEDDQSVKVRMRRLYVLYRLPHLKSIDHMRVSRVEKDLARPETPNGKRVSKQNWLIEKDELDDSEVFAVEVSRSNTDNELKDESESDSDSDGDGEHETEVESDHGCDVETDGSSDSADSNASSSSQDEELYNCLSAVPKEEITEGSHVQTECLGDNFFDTLLDPEACDAIRRRKRRQKADFAADKRSSSSWAKLRMSAMAQAHEPERGIEVDHIELSDSNLSEDLEEAKGVHATLSTASNSEDGECEEEEERATEITVSLVGEKLVELGLSGDSFEEIAVIEIDSSESTHQSMQSEHRNKHGIERSPRRETTIDSLEVDLSGTVKRSHDPTSPKITADALKRLNRHHSQATSPKFVDDDDADSIDMMSVASSQYGWSASCGVLSFGAFRRDAICSGSRDTRHRKSKGSRNSRRENRSFVFCGNDVAVACCHTDMTDTKYKIRKRSSRHAAHKNTVKPLVDASDDLAGNITKEKHGSISKHSKTSSKRSTSASKSLSSPFPMQFRQRTTRAPDLSAMTATAAHVTSGRRENNENDFFQESATPDANECPMDTISGSAPFVRGSPFPAKAAHAQNHGLPPTCPGPRRVVAKPISPLKTRKCRRLLRRLRTSKQNARSMSVLDIDDDDDDDDDEEDDDDEDDEVTVSSEGESDE